MSARCLPRPGIARPIGLTLEHALTFIGGYAVYTVEVKGYQGLIRGNV